MKIIITIDDVEEETLNILLKERFDTPFVFGIPVGLMGKELEEFIISSKELIEKALRTLKVEIASHGYYHVCPEVPSYKNFRTFLKMFFSTYDKVEYLKRTIGFIFRKKFLNPKFNYDIEREISWSKNELETNFHINVITFLYPGGYITKEIIKKTSSFYKFARTSEFGINYVSGLKTSRRFFLKNISVSKYTDFQKLEKYYEKLHQKEKTIDEEFLLIETYHRISEKVGNEKSIYEINYKEFKRHINFLKNKWQILRFLDM